MIDPLRASPFHARTAAANRSNAWVAQNGVTLSRTFANALDEALAARTRVAISDLSSRAQQVIDGTRTVEFLQRLLTRDVAEMSPSTAIKSLWLSDQGGVRGAATIARLGGQSFWMVSASLDHMWIASASALFDVKVRDVSTSQGGIAVIGPYARATLETTGIQGDLAELSFRKVFWRGLEVILSRFGEHGGYEIWCAPDDAIVVWDRIVQAGTPFGVQPVGTAAMDILDVEAGVPRPGRDYHAATDGDAAAPVPLSLGIQTLIDREHTRFNGRTALMKSHAQERRRLVGLEMDCEYPAPYTPLFANRQVGRTLSSVFSPALRRAIALAQVDESAAKPGTRLTLTLPPTLERAAMQQARGTVVDLPFLSPPDPITV